MREVAPTEEPQAPAVPDAGAVRARVAAVEARLDALETLEPVARTLAFAAVQGLAGLYGEGLARIVGGLESWRRPHEDARESGENGVEARGNGVSGAAAGKLVEASDPLESLLEDELVTHLLILHDLHPLDLATRVEQALDEMRPYLRSHGGDAVVVGIEGAVVQLRMIGSCQGCPASALTLRDAVETAIRRVAPEIERVEEVGGGSGGDGRGGGEERRRARAGARAGAGVELVQIGGRRGG